MVFSKVNNLQFLRIYSYPIFKTVSPKAGDTLLFCKLENMDKVVSQTNL